MPSFRFKKKIGPVRGIGAFLDLRASISRGSDESNKRERENSKAGEDCGTRGSSLGERLELAEREVERQRGLLAEKERQITRLRMRTSTAGGQRQPRRGGTEPGALPNFLIPGAQKAGTTFLYYLLNQHPLVEPATKKEINYFDVNFSKGEEWYRSHFPPRSIRDRAEVMSGEASPYYLYHPHAARRAARTVPRARMVALLRDPVERAYSEYHHRYREGRETLDFEAAIEAESERLDGELEKMLADEHYVSPNHRKFSYLSRGIYVGQIREWHRHFDASQILVLESERFFKDPGGVLERILEFLDLPEWGPGPELLEDFPTRHEGDYAPIPGATRRRLEEFFRPHNERLYEYLGEDFGW